MADTDKACCVTYEAECLRLNEMLSSSEATIRIPERQVEKLSSENSFLRGQIRMAELIFGRKHA